MNEQSSIFCQTITNLITCYIDGENIVQRDYMGNTQVIGKTAAAYNELDGIAQQYRDRLIELGEIEQPKSPEDMMKEMQGTMKDMAGIIADLSAQVKEMKEHGHQQCDGGGSEDVPEHKSAKRDRSGAKGDTGDAGRSERGQSDR